MREDAVWFIVWVIAFIINLPMAIHAKSRTGVVIKSLLAGLFFVLAVIQLTKLF